MKYKIGDKVRVRKDLVPDNYYDKIDYASIMDEFETTDCIITGIMDGIYNINDSKYWFPAEMLELVDDEKILEYALEKLGMSKGELMDEMNRDKEDEEKAKKMVRLNYEMTNYCRLFNGQCRGCKVKEFKHKYDKLGKMKCYGVFKYLKEKGEI